jgi:hypothetical protein
MLECKQRLVNRRRCRKEESQASKCEEVTCELPLTQYANGIVIVNFGIRVLMSPNSREHDDYLYTA